MVKSPPFARICSYWPATSLILRERTRFASVSSELILSFTS